MACRLSSILLVLALAAPAWGQAWDNVGAVPRVATETETTFQYDFTDLTASAGLLVSQCSTVLAAFDASVLNSNADASVQIQMCSDPNNSATCIPFAQQGDETGTLPEQPIKPARDFIRAVPLTAPVVPDIARVTIICAVQSLEPGVGVPGTGDGAKHVSANTAGTPGVCSEWDANGNLVDAESGLPCGSSGGLPVTATEGQVTYPSAGETELTGNTNVTVNDLNGELGIGAKVVGTRNRTKIGPLCPTTPPPAADCDQIGEAGNVCVASGPTVPVAEAGWYVCREADDAPGSVAWAFVGPSPGGGGGTNFTWTGDGSGDAVTDGQTVTVSGDSANTGYSFQQGASRVQTLTLDDPTQARTSLGFNSITTYAELKACIEQPLAGTTDITCIAEPNFSVPTFPFSDTPGAASEVWTISANALVVYIDVQQATFLFEQTTETADGTALLEIVTQSTGTTVFLVNGPRFLSTKADGNQGNYSTLRLSGLGTSVILEEFVADPGCGTLGGFGGEPCAAALEVVSGAFNVEIVRANMQVGQLAAGRGIVDETQFTGGAFSSYRIVDSVLIERALLDGELGWCVVDGGGGIGQMNVEIVGGYLECKGNIQINQGDIQLDGAEIADPGGSPVSHLVSYAGTGVAGNLLALLDVRGSWSGGAYTVALEGGGPEEILLRSFGLAWSEIINHAGAFASVRERRLSGSILNGGGTGITCANLTNAQAGTNIDGDANGLVGMMTDAANASNRVSLYAGGAGSVSGCTQSH